MQGIGAALGAGFYGVAAGGDGQDVFVAGAICFPSSWAPEEKLGLPVHTIHDPVPTLNEQLGARIGKFLAGIRPGKAWERVNWGLSGSPD